MPSSWRGDVHRGCRLQRLDVHRGCRLQRADVHPGCPLQRRRSTRVAHFNQAPFTGVAVIFNGATFTGDAHFNQAKFNWDAFPTPRSYPGRLLRRGAATSPATPTSTRAPDVAALSLRGDVHLAGLPTSMGQRSPWYPHFDGAEFAGSVSPQIHHYLSDEQLNQNLANPGPEKPRPPTCDVLVDQPRSGLGQ